MIAALVPLAFALSDDCGRSCEPAERDNWGCCPAPEVERPRPSAALLLYGPEARFRGSDHAPRLAEIARLEQQGTTPDDLFALAQLYEEEGLALYTEEMWRTTSELDRCFDTPGCELGDPGPEQLPTASLPARAVAIYRRLLAEHPDFISADEVGWRLGRALLDLGRPGEADAAFSELVSAHPGSPRAPEAWTLLGKYRFDRGQYAEARAAYGQAIAHPDRPQLWFPRYMVAWCDYEMGDLAAAIVGMDHVVDERVSAQASATDAMRVEALPDLVRFYADGSDIDTAHASFARFGTGMLSEMLLRLARVWTEEHRFDEAVFAYRRALSVDPWAPRAPEIQDEIVHLRWRAGRRDDAVTEIARLLRSYGDGAHWSRLNAADLRVVREATERGQRDLRDAAIATHLEACGATSAADRERLSELAKRLYSEYLARFSRSFEAADVRYAYAGLLYLRAEYEAAYDEYMALARTESNGALAESCVTSAIFAADALIATGSPGAERRAEEARERFGALFPGRAVSAVRPEGWIFVKGEPVILGALSRSRIEEVIWRELPEIRLCYTAERAKDPTLAGSMIEKFVIARDGHVSSATTKSSTMSNAELESCVSRRFLQLRFPEPEGGGIVIVSYPLDFAAL